MASDLWIGIAPDDEFEPGNHADNKTEINEAVEKINAGEWAAYKIAVFKGDDADGEEPLEIIHGYVTDAGFDGRYDRPDQIHNEYLRESARSMLDGVIAAQQKEDA